MGGEQRRQRGLEWKEQQSIIQKWINVLFSMIFIPLASYLPLHKIYIISSSYENLITRQTAIHHLPIAELHYFV